MRKLITFVLLLSLAIIELEAQSISGYYPTKSQTDSLKAIADREAKKYLIRKAQAIEWAHRNGIPVTREVKGAYIEIQYIDEFGHPQFYKTDNANAAATISTNKVYSGGGAGLSLTGSGITVREWDGGSALPSHQEFGGRVTVVDGASSNYHSTHVAGTIMASGVVAAAKGMAYQANLRSFDWNSDVSEMATEGLAGALISNHSYGFVRGWYWDGYQYVWNGDPAISSIEDYLFGFYDVFSQQWDQVAYNAPYLLICKAAGNDRGESGTGYPPDGPYDCIDQLGIAKNILTVGAVDDIPGGYTTPTDVVMSSFSSWGPADDGRIKPDISANGIGLYSTYNTNNSSYETLSGTSMATPSVAGSLALLQQHYYNLKSNYLRSATMKALVIHTADEAGPNPGPDYMFGWGLMNTKNAALKISEDQTKDVIGELTLNNGATYTRNVVAIGNEPLKVTIVWTDPAGTPPAPSLDPITPMLVNDLDLRITRSATTYFPWKLDRDNPANAATNTGENNVDNVEVVFIASPVAGSTYTITVDHDGTLSGGSQAYSIVISGITTAGTAVVNTNVATAMTFTTATSGGNVTSDGGSAVTARGVCWATTSDPVVTGSHTTNGTGTGSFTSSITGLSPATLYHVRAYATTANGTAYGDDLTFTTLGVYSVTTTVPASITNTTATSGGTAVTDGGYAITARGVCWATTINPVVTGNHTTDGSGAGTFTSTITGLTASTLYHVRAYATTSNGTVYGSDLIFTTLCPSTGAFTEGFEGTTFPPECWSLSMVLGTYNWTRTSAASGYGSGTGSAFADFWSQSSGSVYELKSLPVNLSGISNPVLKFNYAHASYASQVDQMNVYYSTDYGNNFTLLLEMPGGTTGILNTAGGMTTPFVPTSAQWATQTLTLPAGTNMVKFTALSAFGNNLYLDDIQVTEKLAHDVSAISVDIAAVHTTGDFTPQATVKNLGSNTETFPVTMTIGSYTSTKTVTALAPDAIQQVAFDSRSATVGDYTVQVCTQLAGDLKNDNNCKSQGLKILNLNKQVYAYNAYTGTGTDPIGPTTFNLSSPGTLNSIADQSGMNFISGGTWAEGKWYGTVYYSYEFITLDPATGARTVIGTMPFDVNGLSYNPDNGTMYGINYDGTNSNLYSINVTNGLTSFIGTCGTGLLINLAINNSGEAYAVDISSDVLGTVNLTTGAFTTIGSIGFDAGYAQDMEFDRESGDLYMAAYSADGNGFLAWVDRTTGATLKIGNFEGNAEITGLAIPYTTTFATHFVPVWWPGSGMDHMNLYAYTATLDNVALQPGDEIGIFDANVCVGMGVLTQVLNGTVILSMVASRDDPDTPLKDGYTIGNTITYRVWDSSAGSEVSNVVATYISGSGIYAVGATSAFHLSALTFITQDISLTSGWNIMSFAVQPTNMSMLSIVNPLITAATLTKVQDERGNAIEQLPAPIGWVDNIGLMKIEEGYKIKVTVNTTLSVTGQPVTLPYTLALSTGWNIMGYPSMNSRAALPAFNPLITAATLLKVQDEAGNAIEQLPAPIGWIDNIINLTPGHGYKVKTTANTTLTISSPGKGEYQNAEGTIITRPTHFKLAYTGNGLDQMNIYIKKPTVGGVAIKTGDEIGVFDGNLCVGAVVVNDPNQEYYMVVASLDDPGTKEADGFKEGNNLELRLWDNQAGLERKAQQMEIDKGYNKTFEKLGTSVLAVDFETVIYTSLGDAFPNPSTDKTTFTFQLGKESKVRLEIFNMDGDLIKVLVDRNMAGGTHQIEWDNRSGEGTRASSGVYFYRLKLDNFMQTKQLVIN